MKKLLINILAFCILCSSSFGTCNFATGIKSLPDGNFEYTKECHLAVGQLVETNGIQAKQISDYTKAISLKDLALKESDSRATLWSSTASNLEGRIQKIDSLEETNKFLYFGLGVLATGFAAYTANKIGGH